MCVTGVGQAAALVAGTAVAAVLVVGVGLAAVHVDGVVVATVPGLSVRAAHCSTWSTCSACGLGWRSLTAYQ